MTDLKNQRIVGKFDKFMDYLLYQSIYRKYFRGVRLNYISHLLLFFELIQLLKSRNLAEIKKKKVKLWILNWKKPFLDLVYTEPENTKSFSGTNLRSARTVTNILNLFMCMRKHDIYVFCCYHIFNFNHKHGYIKINNMGIFIYEILLMVAS